MDINICDVIIEWLSSNKFDFELSELRDIIINLSGQNDFYKVAWVYTLQPRDVIYIELSRDRSLVDISFILDVSSPSFLHDLNKILLESSDNPEDYELDSILETNPKEYP